MGSRASTSTVWLDAPAGTVTPPPTTARWVGSAETTGTKVSPRAGPDSATVSGTGRVGAPLAPWRTKLVAGARLSSVGWPRTRSAAWRGSSFIWPLR